MPLTTDAGSFVVDLGAATEPDIDLVGAEARRLAEMLDEGFPVPAGAVLLATAGRRYLRSGDLPVPARAQLAAGLDRLAESGRPCVVSVRASPPPGMESVLPGIPFVGATLAFDDVAAWGSVRAAADARARFLRSFAETVRRIPGGRLDSAADEILGSRPLVDLMDDELIRLADVYEALIADEAGRPVPDSLPQQVIEACEAVIAAWEASPARRRRLEVGIPDELATAVIIELSVFGTIDDDSGAGMAYSRDPATGTDAVVGRWRPCAHVADVSAALRFSDELPRLGAVRPALVGELTAMTRAAERRRRDAVRIDFVVERGRLWTLDARPEPRLPSASVEIAVGLVSSGVIDADEALFLVEPTALEILRHHQIDDPEALPLAKGVGASPGAATGRLAFTADGADEPIILARHELDPASLRGARGAAGIITAHGGRTSHAAVAAHAMGIPAVTGVPGLIVDTDNETLEFADGTLISAGEVVTIDGTRGAIYTGALQLVPPNEPPAMATLLSWADTRRRLQIWANVDTPQAAEAARRAGAEGVGLARTEYMFSGERLEVVRSIILERDPKARADALARLEDEQIGDFEQLLEIMDGLPVVVRLLDPPLHEFLPDRADVERRLVEARAAGQDTTELDELLAAIERWHEANPMLGLRGVRFAVVFPEIYRIQVLAALEAVRRRLDAGGDPMLEIMVPLVASVEELRVVRDMIEEEVHNAGRLLEVTIGTMIELPRAALVAGEIASMSDFFSFGTNDLTQTALGISRDDAEEAFLRTYLEEGVFSHNPFETIDPDGVGRLIRIAVEEGRAADPRLEVGICGEHGADPRSVIFFDALGVDYVSCSPPRIAVARLAAAQSALRRAAVTGVPAGSSG